jgi:hypothetical protein
MAQQTLIMLEMMDFEGVEQIRDRVARQAQQLQQTQQPEQLKPLLMTMAAQLDEHMGQAHYLPKVQQLLGGMQPGKAQAAPL